MAVRKRLLGLIADGIFVCPDQLMVNTFAKTGNVWYYRFDYRASKTYWNKWLEGSCAHRLLYLLIVIALGALHADELQFVWGSPYREDVKDNYDDKDREISDLMMKIWSQFATTG